MFANHLLANITDTPSDMQHTCITSKIFKVISCSRSFSISHLSAYMAIIMC
jgi:hypothetical protein